jgi:hypothetical protein
MSIDMTQNRVPYGLLTDEEKAALQAHAEAYGAFVFYSDDDKAWHPTRPVWVNDFIYRTVPLPLTQDEIAWDRVPDWVEHVVRDEDEEVLGYSLEPSIEYANTFWSGNGKRRRIDDFPGIVIKRGTCDWKDSKQRRPQK